MNVINKAFLLFSIVVLSVIVSCSKDQTIDNFQEKDINLENAEQKADFLSSMVISHQRTPIVYSGELCGDVITATHANANSISNPALWDYYSFEGNAGDIIGIYVPRTSPGMDPSFRLHTGLVSDSSQAFCCIIQGGDDQEPDPFNSCFDDPRIVGFPLPSTGTYTLSVFDFDSCGSPLEYEIITTGISCVTDTDGDGINDDDEINNGSDETDPCDPFQLPGYSDYDASNTIWAAADCDGDGMLNGDEDSNGTDPYEAPDLDGDGCLDATDPHPNSDHAPTVIIGGCDSGIENVFITDCSTMSDLIADCAATAIDHGDFVSCVTHLTNEWKSAGFIVGNEKGDIVSCAGQSNLP